MQLTLITLFELDLTELTTESLVYRFFESQAEAKPITFKDNVYLPLPIESTGWELTGQGTLPSPRIKFANVNRVFSSGLIFYNDLLGTTVTRLRLLVDNIDNDGTLNVITDFRPDIFQIECNTAQNKLFVEFELSVKMDQQGTLLPKRQILRDTCTHTYRHWDTSNNQFDYQYTTCPYAAKNGGITIRRPTAKLYFHLLDCYQKFAVSQDDDMLFFSGVS